MSAFTSSNINHRNIRAFHHRFRMKKRVNRSTLGNVMVFIVLALFACFMGLPFLYAIMQSLKPMNELFIFPPRFYVVNPTLNNFYLLTQQVNSLWVPFTRYLFNSVFMTAVATFFEVIVCSMGAFILSKGRIKGRTIIFKIIILTLLFTPDTTSIPRYVIMSWLHMINSYFAIILPAVAAPLGLFLMKQFMENGIPDSLIESAQMDGASPMRIFWTIAMPVARPVWLTMIIFSFQSIWSQDGSQFIYNEALKPLPYLFSQISASGLGRVGVSAAAAVVMMIPPIAVLIFAQNRVIDTMAYSGIK